MMGNTVDREREFFDELWKSTQPREVYEHLEIPTVGTLLGKRVLICSCGSGTEPVLAAKEGAEVYAFDISETAIRKAEEVAAFNRVKVIAEVMDFHDLKYPDDFFDVIYGTSILHHVDCAVAGRQIFRCLKPGGIAYFRENSDRNPILRFLRRLLFGSPGGYQRQKFWFIKRTGTTDEYPLTEEEVAQLSDIFGGHIKRYYPRFYFFYLLYFVGWRNERFGKLLWDFDTAIGDLFPFLKRYSFVQDLLLQKPGG